MKTKKDFWKTVIYAYVAIISGVIILLAIPSDSKAKIYFLLAVIILEVLGIIIILLAVIFSQLAPIYGKKYYGRN